MYPDYHMHTNFSDGRDTHEDMLASAQMKGISEIGFTDHISVKPIGWSMDLFSIPLMIETVGQLKEKSSNIAVKLGAEVDYIAGKEKQIAELLKQIPLDYCIGSVHFVDDWNFDTDIAPYDQININAFYRNYFDLVQRSAKSGLYDIMGHCDLAKKFAYYPSLKLDKLYEETAKVFSDYGITYELNTSGKNKPCAEFYPSIKFVEILHHYKVPVTLGSDAHVEQNIGQYFQEAVSLLKLVGYKELSTFLHRKRVLLKL
ncbi:histidinol-phosphatase [Tenuifilaceae bacterium CYCD]|nr:histidinol-phosphatase [Tenuifilaceae bacterium CYCD]